MNTFKNISSELKSFFSTNPVFKILMPIDVFFVFGGLAVLVLNYLNFILVGRFFFALGWFGLALGIVLAFADYHLMFLYIGFLGAALLEAINFVWLIIKFGYWDWQVLFTCAAAAVLGYFVFRKSTVHEG